MFFDGQSRMDNLEKLATLGTQDTRRRTNKIKNTTLAKNHKGYGSAAKELIACLKTVSILVEILILNNNATIKFNTQ
jgi:hypothetical protein